jgi:hypothetical protein
MAQAPDYSKAYGSAISNALMIAQTRKTNAEATIVEDQREDKIGFKPAFLRSATSRVCAVFDISVCQAR